MPDLYQTGKGIRVVYREEATLNTAPGVSNAYVLPLTPSPGLKLEKAAIRSETIRADGQKLIARHGSRSITGSFNGELAVGAFDNIIAAVFRSTHTAALAVGAATASLASISFGTNTITATSTSAGSGFLQAGIRVGDVFRVSGVTTDGSANHSTNLRVKAVTTHTLTVHGTGQLTASTTAAATFTLTVGKKIINGTQPTRRSFYVEQNYLNIDQSEVFGGVRWTGITLRGTPDGMATVELRGLGVSEDTLTATSSAPYYTDYTTYTSPPLTFADARISLGGEDIAIATSFEMNANIVANTEPVIGSDVTPDVFDNDFELSGSLSIIRDDLDRVGGFDAETEYELLILLKENESAPADYISFFVPKLKFMGVDAPLGNDSAMVETIPWEAGIKEASAGYDQTTWSCVTSAT